MKKVYTLALLSFALFLSSCSKDIFKNYEDRIEGTWELTDIDRIGWGNFYFPFSEGGSFVFHQSGRLEYIDQTLQVHDGSWNIQYDMIRGDCYTDANGDYECDDRQVKSLDIQTVDFSTRQVRSEHFDEVRFTGTDSFNAYIYNGSTTYTFRFRRR